MKNWKDRVKKEQEDLDDKRGRLSCFIEGEAFESLPKEAQDLLYKQESLMGEYSLVLSQRLEL